MVVGYLSLRSHANYIGIPGVTGLSVVVFLAECHVFVVSTLSYLFLGALVSLLIYVVTLIILVFIHKKIAFELVNSWCVSCASWLRCSASGNAVTIVVLIFLVAWILLCLGADTDVAVGTLRAEALRPASRYPYIVSLLLLVGILLCWRPSFDVPRREFSLRHTAVVTLLVLVTILLPAIFGRNVRPARYPLALVMEKENAKNSCGLLVVLTDQTAVLWMNVGPGSSPAGTMRIVPHDGFKSITEGPLVDLLEVGRKLTYGNDMLSEGCAKLNRPESSDKSLLFDSERREHT